MKKTTKELIDAYCEKYHINITKGDGAAFLLPFLTMIVALDVYNEKIMPMALTGEAKYIRKMWAQEYHKFERIITFAFSIDHLADLGELTDGFEEAIKRDMIILSSTIYNNLPINDAARKNLILHALVINVLTQCANVMWEDIYGNKSTVLTNLEHIALRLCDKLNPHLEANVFNHPQQVVDAVTVLCTKMGNYLEKEIR